MNEKKTFSLSDAAKIVDVPRTTINDWISKHANYLHFELKGKRKVLDDAGIEVLKEIKELRDSGLSASEIELKLAENHPVKADQVTENEVEPTQKENVESPDYAIIVKRQTDEIGSLLSDHLQNLATRLQEAELAQKNFSRRMIRSVVSTVLIMLLLPLMHKNLESELKNTSETAQKYQSENFKLLMDLKSDAEKIKGKDQEITKVTNLLDKRDKDYQRTVNKLMADMQTRKKKFEEDLQKLSKNAATSKQAEIARLRDEFAAKQLEVLKKLDQMQQELEKKDKLVAHLSKTSEAQTKVIKDQADTLKKVLEQAKNETNPPMEKNSPEK
jgi:DNA-binding transcriptional MerR regulator